MAMGTRKQREKQEGIWIAQVELASAPGHPFYQRLNGLLESEGFDAFVEERCANYGFRRDDHQSLFPFRPQPPGGNPKQAIKSKEVRSRLSPLQTQDLLAQGQILEQEVTSRIKAASKQT
jgi:hypothetical protein